ncbi:hypothetical protein [Rhodococcus sp. 14-2470-1a]|uniref:T3SS (YopN, CesT) and YbjN peptide-binding chaperone 1 n=1 Tax=Rhodococcus sp. 14-2470-1a TaxID=2023150 RepID=UPI000B9BB440|nr:hypothetical protein [Rhodococcus sp. 14-2470-1a]OZF51605.1 hypothetical protein CH292_11360 [Rhodococcus sp. 14-2470-1a]
MPKHNGPDLDAATQSDWTRFTTELADHLASLEPGAELSISPDFEPEGSPRRAMLLRLTAEGTLVCASSGLGSPPPPWQPAEADGIFVVEDGAAWVDRLCSTVVEQIRCAWNIPHPSFLFRPGAKAPTAPTPDESACPPDVAGPLLETFGDRVSVTPDGVVSIAIGPVIAYVTAAGVDEIRIHALVVERIAGRTRAAEVVADLNRRHPRLKFLLVEDRVHVACTIDADPFLPQHVVNAAGRLAKFAATVDEEFADHVGGVVPTHDATEQVDGSADPSDEELPPQLMTLLEMDAESGGKVDADDIVSVCGPDRAKIGRFEAFCTEQAESWREYAQEAMLRGESAAAEECALEAVPWDRVVRALRSALAAIKNLDNV